MTHPVNNFILKLLLVVGVTFLSHIYILKFNNIDLFQNLIVLAYSVNFVLAIGIFIGLYKLRIKHEHILGFVFMAGSFVKFTVFFIFFYPTYRIDGIINKLETTSFLVPYMVCLIVETFFLSKLLNKKI